MTSSRPEFPYHDPVYLRAREAAFARSNDLCQLCGQQPAVEAHHWAVDYPPAHKTTANDLTALCADCHSIATTLRRFTRAGGSRHQFCALVSEAVTRCDLNSPLPASPPSSCTTEYPCCQGPRIEGRARPPRVVNPYIQAPASTCTYDGRTSRPIPTSPPVSVRTDREVTVPARGSDGRARRTRRSANP